MDEGACMALVIRVHCRGLEASHSCLGAISTKVYEHGSTWSVLS